MRGIRPRQKIVQADWKGYMAQRAQQAKNPALQQFFGTPLPDPETPISEVPMVALDMETTGWMRGAMRLLVLASCPSR